MDVMAIHDVFFCMGLKQRPNFSFAPQAEKVWEP